MAKVTRLRSKTKGRNQNPLTPPQAAVTEPAEVMERGRSRPGEQTSEKLKKGRLIVVWLLMLVGAIGLGSHLWRLQIVDGPKLANKAQQQQMTSLRPYVPRRPIIDRQRSILATDRLIYTLYVHPKQFKKSKEEIAAKLAELVEKPEGELLNLFSQRETGIRVKSNLAEERADRIAALGFDGLELIRQYSRLYPQQELASDVVGYVNLDHKGQAGLEYTQQKLLERTVRPLRLQQGADGSLIPTHLPDDFLKLDDYSLQLTIDMRLQRAARSHLKQQITKYKAKRGAVMVMDVRDGSILALVCEPTFDPNEYSKYDIQLFKNWMVTDLYEPGSTFKPINVAIALDQKAIRPTDRFKDVGKMKIERWEIKNHDFKEYGARGWLNIAQIFAHSSNIGMVNLMQKVNPQKYYQTLKQISLTDPTGIELPGEASGQLKAQDEFLITPVEIATASFGQGFSVTPLKLAQLHGAIANGGKLIAPHLIRGLVDSKGHLQSQSALRPARRIFSAETSRTILNLMETSLVSSKSSALISGYRIAGKTGTSQKASANGGYSEKAWITSFVGTFPAEAPRYLVLALVDEPQGTSLFGSTVAAPIAKDVMEALISIEGIPPSRRR